MSEEFFIRINKLEWDYRTGGVVSAQWEMVATDETFEGVEKQQTSFDPNPELSSFVPIESVTEDIVISWLESTLLNEQMEIYRDRATNSLKKAKLPPLVSGLPWEMQ